MDVVKNMKEIENHGDAFMPNFAAKFREKLPKVMILCDFSILKWFSGVDPKVHRT